MRQGDFYFGMDNTPSLEKSTLLELCFVPCLINFSTILLALDFGNSISKTPKDIILYHFHLMFQYI